jgi:demethoxyubiquinone hydroxylase (CLK1/Coq7/Cat5 family)
MKTAAAVALEALETPSAAPEKKKPKRKRSHVERFRTDDEEHDALHALALESGLSFGAFVRSSTIGSAGPRSKRAPPTEASRLKADHVVAMNRWGNLCNQGIYSLNQLALAAPDRRSRDEFLDARELLRAAVAGLIKTLAHVRGEPD